MFPRYYIPKSEAPKSESTMRLELSGRRPPGPRRAPTGGGA
jgi:hypothetical protein